MNKNVLITGGAGFIGSNLSLQLLELNYNVTVLDNLSPQIHGNAEESQLYLSIKDKVKFIIGDVRNKKCWEKALQGQNMVVHLAAETGTGQSMYEINKYADINIMGTAILLDHLVNQQHTIEKVVVASSRAIYGEGKYFCNKDGNVFPSQRSKDALQNGEFETKCPICNGKLELKPTDEVSQIHPTSLYGITKQNQEQMILTICKAIDLPAVALRYQNVYGPGQSLKNPYTGILSIFSTQIRNGNSINIFEDGNESRDFVYIDDVVNATILALETRKGFYEAYNVGSGVPTTVIEVASRLREHYKTDINISITGNFRIGDIRHNYADLTKVNKIFNFSPIVDFNTGIEKFASWVMTQNVELDKYQNSINELKLKKIFN